MIIKIKPQPGFSLPVWMEVTACCDSHSVLGWPVLTPEMDFFTLLPPLDLLNVSVDSQLLL